MILPERSGQQGKGTPLLAQLFVFYLGFGIFGHRVPSWIAASVALTIYASVFLAPRGSRETT